MLILYDPLEPDQIDLYAAAAKTGGRHARRIFHLGRIEVDWETGRWLCGDGLLNILLALSDISLSSHNAVKPEYDPPVDGMRQKARMVDVSVLTDLAARLADLDIEHFLAFRDRCSLMRRRLNKNDGIDEDNRHRGEDRENQDDPLCGNPESGDIHEDMMSAVRKVLRESGIPNDSVRLISSCPRENDHVIRIEVTGAQRMPVVRMWKNVENELERDFRKVYFGASVPGAVFGVSETVHSIEIPYIVISSADDGRVDDD